MVDNHATSKTRLVNCYLTLMTTALLFFFLSSFFFVTPPNTAAATSAFGALVEGQQEQQEMQQTPEGNGRIPSETDTNTTRPVIAADEDSNNSNNNDNGGSNTLLYENPKYGIQIRYPQNWIYREEENSLTGDFMATFISPTEALRSQRANTTAPLVGVFTRTLPVGNLDLHTFGELNVQGLTSSGNKIISTSYSAVLSGLPAFEVLYMDLNGTMILQDWALYGDRGYALIYGSPESSFEQLLPVAQSMISSFKITNPNANTTTSLIENNNNNTSIGNTLTDLNPSSNSQSPALESQQLPSMTEPTYNGNQGTTILEAARQRYLQVWNHTQFYIPFSTYIEPGSAAGYGIYKEHKGNSFGPGETIQLYLEPVAFGHQKLVDQDGTPLYGLNLTADILISDRAGNEVASIKDVPLGSMVSHRQNTELHAVLTLTQKTPFPAGDYQVAYIIHDQVSKGNFEINKNITISGDTAGLTPVQRIEAMQQ